MKAPNSTRNSNPRYPILSIGRLHPSSRTVARDSTNKGKVGILPSHQLLWFLASIYLDPGFDALISQRRLPWFYPLGNRVGGLQIIFLQPFVVSISLQGGLMGSFKEVR